MIYAKLTDASALQCLDVALSEATKPKWYQRLLIIKLSATREDVGACNSQRRSIFAMIALGVIFISITPLA